MGVGDTGCSLLLRFWTIILYHRLILTTWRIKKSILDTSWNWWNFRPRTWKVFSSHKIRCWTRWSALTTTSSWRTLLVTISCWSTTTIISTSMLWRILIFPGIVIAQKMKQISWMQRDRYLKKKKKFRNLKKLLSRNKKNFLI